MAGRLRGRRVAAVVARGFEQVALLEPRAALEAEGAVVEVVSPEAGSVRGWNRTDWGDTVRVDRSLDQARAADYDALLVPGGVMSPDRLRMNPDAVRLVREFLEHSKPIAAICHGPWLLIEAGIVRGITMTSYLSVKTDLINAGAVWVDREVVVDQGIITSRRPADLPAFIRGLVAALGECGAEAAVPGTENPLHRAANCRWGVLTLFLEAPFWWDAERCPWACIRAAVPRVLETTEVCHTCAHWMPRPAAASTGEAPALTATGP